MKKILLVDYEPRVTALVRKALEDTGRYVIREEHDTRQALNAAKWFRPDLILLDINPASRAGDLVARQLHDDPEFCDTPLVFLGVNTSSQGGVMSAGILSGYSFFANPIRVDDFVRYVGELFRVPAELLASGYRVAKS